MSTDVIPPADAPPKPQTPVFLRSIPIERALDPTTLVAYRMNGEDLTLGHGAPLRLIVPGWFATYWVKALSDVRVLTDKAQSFWMEKGYRIPTAPGGCETADHLATETTPIHRMNVRSLFVRPEPGERFTAGTPTR